MMASIFFLALDIKMVNIQIIISYFFLVAFLVFIEGGDQGTHLSLHAHFFLLFLLRGVVVGDENKKHIENCLF